MLTLSEVKSLIKGLCKYFLELSHKYNNQIVNRFTMIFSAVWIYIALNVCPISPLPELK